MNILRNFAFASAGPIGGSERRGKEDHDEGDREDAGCGRDNDAGKRAIQRGRPQKGSVWGCLSHRTSGQKDRQVEYVNPPYGSQRSGLTQGPYLPGVRTADGLAAVRL